MQERFNRIARATTESTHIFQNSTLEHIRKEAEIMGKDIVVNFDLKRPLTTPNRYCKTLRRTVKEVSDRHNLVFKGIVNRLKPNEASTFPTFVIVADKIF